MKKRIINWLLRSRIKRDKASVFFEPTIRLRWKKWFKSADIDARIDDKTKGKIKLKRLDKLSELKYNREVEINKN